MFRKLIVSISSVTILFSTNITSANSFPADVLTMKKIEIESEDFTSEDSIQIRLYMNDPLNNNWSPVSGLTGQFLQTQLVYCPTSNWNGTNCLGGAISMSEISEIDKREGNEISFLASHKFNEGSYVLWRVMIYEANSFSDPHDYRRHLRFVMESGFARNDISVPSFTQADLAITKFEEIVPEPEIEEVIPEEPPVVVVPPPAPPTGRSQDGSSQPASPVVVNELLEQEVLALPLSGNQVWKPMRGIKGKFENWKVGRKNSINGVNPLFTRTNLSMMTFRTTGDSVSLRYLGGKKRGSFSIYVNGVFVERIDAKTKKKRKLVKTWEGLGEGRHFVDIVAELDRGESIAINGVQRPRLN